MKDLLILITSARANLYCENCKRIKPHQLNLYYDDTNQSFELVKECLCFKETEKFKTVYSVKLNKKPVK